MVLSHVFPKLWFVTLNFRDKNSSLHLEALRISFQSDSEFLTPLWQWWSSCLLTELEGTRPWLKTWIQQNIVKYTQQGNEIPVAQICQPDLNQTRHPRWKRIHILAKTLTSTLLLDSVYIWTKVNVKMMDRTFLIHTSLDEVQHPWVSKGRRWKELLESWVLGPVCRALCSCWGLQEARVLSRIKQLQLCFVSTS